MAKTPIVKKFMKKASRTFNENEEMAPCMSVLARSSFAAIPIVNDDNEVVGLLTEKDVIRTVIVSHTMTDVAALALMVLVRAFLSFTLTVEIEGKLPWIKPGKGTAGHDPGTN